MQTRDFRHRKFQPTPEGDEHDPPNSFYLIQDSGKKCRRSDREIWRDLPGTTRLNLLKFTRIEMADFIAIAANWLASDTTGEPWKYRYYEFSRREVSSLIADAADWLAYQGED